MRPLRRAADKSIPTLSRLFLLCRAGREGIFESAARLKGTTNLRTTLEKIIARAGVKQWPKLWQNLRASGTTDFARTLPSHVAAEICGHTERVAQEHYWTVLDSDLDQAITELSPTIEKSLSPKGGDKLSKKLSIGDDLKGPGMSLAGEAGDLPKTRKAREIPGFDDICQLLADDDFTIKIGPEGLEPPTKGLCLPPRLSPPLSGSWSGLSLLFTSSPYSLYTFLRRRLGSGLAYLKRLSFPRI